MFWPRIHSARRSATIGDSMELFNRAIGVPFVERSRNAAPAFNIWTDENGAVMTSELPGVAIEDLDITVSGKEVIVAGGRKAEESDAVRAVKNERGHGDFRRAFELPFSVDSNRVEATLANGVLQISLPRAESDKPRKIAISG